MRSAAGRVSPSIRPRHSNALPVRQACGAASRRGWTNPARAATGSKNRRRPHVNKVSTRVTLLFDLDGSPSLSDIQKARIHAALSGRIGKDGVLRVVAQTTRSQLTNKGLAVERFVALLREALTPRPPRRKTRATLASKRRRLETKRRRGTVKQQRSRLPEVED